MAVRLVNVDRTTQLVANTGDFVIVDRDVTMNVAAGAIITQPGGSSTVTVRVDGTVIGGGAGISLVGSGSDHSVSIGRTGVVIADTDDALRVFGDGSAIQNAGEVFGNQKNGINASGNDITIENSGTIQTGAAAFGSAITMLGSDGLVRNSGTILSGNNAEEAIFLSGFGGHRVINTGTISATKTALRGSTGDEHITNAGQIDGDVLLGSGDDVFRGMEGVLDGRIEGGDGADVLRLGAGNDVAAGDAGADTVSGGAGDDRLEGGDGDDVLKGGADDDIMSGGAGADQFVFAELSGSDRISDFENRVDLIDLRAFHLAGVGAIVGDATQQGADTVIDLTGIGGGIVVLEDFRLSQLNAADFLF